MAKKVGEYVALPENETMVRSPGAPVMLQLAQAWLAGVVPSLMVSVFIGSSVEGSTPSRFFWPGPKRPPAACQLIWLCEPHRVFPAQL